MKKAKDPYIEQIEALSISINSIYDDIKRAVKTNDDSISFHELYRNLIIDAYRSELYGKYFANNLFTDKNIIKVDNKIIKEVKRLRSSASLSTASGKTILSIMSKLKKSIALELSIIDSIDDDSKDKWAQMLILRLNDVKNDLDKIYNKLTHKFSTIEIKSINNVDFFNKEAERDRARKVLDAKRSKEIDLEEKNDWLRVNGQLPLKKL